MKVIAKYQLAYKDTAYKYGDEFEMDEADYAEYINDVEKVKKTKTKPVKKVKTKSKK